ncbi:MAG: hypothetical protein IT443_12465 [Phycisphaeraceae bacterium]|nr:hypothetical protein [Phycisphaeraceae bacterium]
MSPSAPAVKNADDLIFIHHSCGNDWLKRGLHEALLAKPYVNQRNDICYGVDVKPDAGRPDSLRIDGKVPGDRTDMNHWILWFNDYLGSVQTHRCAPGKVNRIVMFKSCFPLSHVDHDGQEPGNPFERTRALTNYKALYRHPQGPGHTFDQQGVKYQALEDIFARNPDTLFIAVTSPPLHYAPQDATDNASAHRARLFNNWLKNEWLPAYHKAHPGLNNVAVYDWFDFLTYPDNDPNHPNRLRKEYGGESGDAHPTVEADQASVVQFATGQDNFLDKVWKNFSARKPQKAAAKR